MVVGNEALPGVSVETSDTSTLFTEMLRFPKLVDEKFLRINVEGGMLLLKSLPGEGGTGIVPSSLA